MRVKSDWNRADPLRQNEMRQGSHPASYQKCPDSNTKQLV